MSFLSEFIELGLLYPCLQSISESLSPLQIFQQSYNYCGIVISHKMSVTFHNFQRI